jgi:hypothetical protein
MIEKTLNKQNYYIELSYAWTDHCILRFLIVVMTVSYCIIDLFGEPSSFCHEPLLLLVSKVRSLVVSLLTLCMMK